MSEQPDIYKKIKKIIGRKKTIKNELFKTN